MIVCAVLRVQGRGRYIKPIADFFLGSVDLAAKFEFLPVDDSLRPSGRASRRFILPLSGAIKILTCYLLLFILN